MKNLEDLYHGVRPEYRDIYITMHRLIANQKEHPNHNKIYKRLMGMPWEILTANLSERVTYLIFDRNAAYLELDEETFRNEELEYELFRSEVTIGTLREIIRADRQKGLNSELNVQNHFLIETRKAVDTRIYKKDRLKPRVKNP